MTAFARMEPLTSLFVYIRCHLRMQHPPTSQRSTQHGGVKRLSVIDRATSLPCNLLPKTWLRFDFPRRGSWRAIDLGLAKSSICRNRHYMTGRKDAWIGTMSPYSVKVQVYPSESMPHYLFPPMPQTRLPKSIGRPLHLVLKHQIPGRVWSRKPD